MRWAESRFQDINVRGAAISGLEEEKKNREFVQNVNLLIGMFLKK